MELFIVIAIVFFLAFFAESILGFGGLIISFTILSFFIDTKDMIFLGLYAATIASIFVVITDYKSFSRKVFLQMFPIALIGTVIGVFLFSSSSNLILLKVFAVFLILVALKSIFFDTITFKSSMLQKSILFIGGVLQGMYGTGGPFSVVAIKDRFRHKSELRTTMAVFFIVFNSIRAIQLTIQNSFDFSIISQFWWLLFPIAVAIFIGYKVHVNVPENSFKKIVNWVILVAAIVLLLK